MQNQEDFTFSALTPDTILDALDSIGVYASSGLLPLNSYENRVYQFVADDSSRYVVKFYRPARWTNDAILEEHDYSEALVEADIPVSAPLRVNGETLHHWKGFRFTLFMSVGGRQFELDNLDHLEWMGRFIGRMHKLGSNRLFEYRQTLDCKSTIDFAIGMLQNSPFIPDTLSKPFWAILTPIAEVTRDNFESIKTSYLRLHGDCHPGNILWRDGPTFVDLDDARNGPAIQDIWMMLSGERSNRLLQLDVMLEAYEEFNDFDKKELALIEPLRAMRIIHHMGWLAQRWEDPAFPRAFPWFGQEKYWENQILSLKEQMAALDEPTLTLI